MNKEDLYRLLGEMDESFIEEAKIERITAKKIRWFPALAAAAVLVVCFMAGNYVRKYVISEESAVSEVMLAEKDTDSKKLIQEELDADKEEPVSHAQVTQALSEPASVENSENKENSDLQNSDSYTASVAPEPTEEPAVVLEQNPGVESGGWENLSPSDPAMGNPTVQGETVTDNDFADGMEASVNVQEPQKENGNPSNESFAVNSMEGSNVIFQNMVYTYGGIAQNEQIGQYLGTTTIQDDSGTIAGNVYGVSGENSLQSIVVEACDGSGYYLYYGSEGFQVE